MKSKRRLAATSFDEDRDMSLVLDTIDFQLFQWSRGKREFLNNETHNNCEYQYCQFVNNVRTVLYLL